MPGDIPIREYVDRRLTDLEMRLESERKAAALAVGVATTAIEARLHILNDRNALTVKEREDYPLRSAVDPRLQRVEAGQNWLWGALAALGALLALILKFQ